MKISYLIAVTWVICLFSFPIKAQIQSNPTGGDWGDPLTWIGNTVPGLGDDVIIDGTVTISNMVSCNNLLLTSSGIIENNPVSYFIVTINGNLTNNGIIRNNPLGLVLGIIINGNIINNGIISNYEIALGGSIDQHISCLNNKVFGSFYFTSLKPSGILISDTDINFTNCTVNLNGNLLMMQDNSKLTIIGMSMSNSTITGNDLHLEMNYGAYITGVSMGANIKLYGIVSVGTGVTFSGDITVNDILQSYNLENSTLIILGNVYNNGWIRNNPFGTLLILKIDGNLSNNGLWENSHTKLIGTTDQYINLVYSQPIFQGLQLLSVIGSTNFEWFLNGSSLISQPGYLGAGASTLSFLGPVNSSHNGTYNCFTDESWSRNIILQSVYPDAILLDIKVFLEGPFDFLEMDADINNILPLYQPYNTGPWNYSGTESVVSIPNEDVVDWILVEIRDATNAASAISSTTISTKAGFILENGDIVSLDGVNPIYFNVTIANNLFAVIRHRNHIDIMNNYPMSESAGVFSYDFTTASDKAYGGVNSQKQIYSGIYGMIAGDGNSDGSIDNNDIISIWSVLAGDYGYYLGDFNLDGHVNNQDKNNVWYSNNSSYTQIP